MTMKYMVVMYQKAEGCDYTIGCGIRTEVFEAEDDNQAAIKSKGVWEDGTYTDDYELSSMTLCRVIAECPVEDWLEELREEQAKEAMKYIEQREREELAMLKRKYES